MCKKILFIGIICFISALLVYQYKKDEIAVYAYGAYLKYWRLPYLKKDIVESLRTGKQLSEYSQETIRLAVQKSPDFLTLWLKDTLTPEQVTQVVMLFKQFFSKVARSIF